MPDLFISYSRRDSAFGRQLHSALRLQGRSVWMDWEDILPTAEWWRAICEGIEASDHFVFLLSPDSLASAICHLEVEYARFNRKRIIPILHRDVDERQLLSGLSTSTLPLYVRTLLGGRALDQLVRDNWNALARHNWVIFRDEGDFDAGLKSLTTALDTDVPHVRQHTRLLVQALEWQANGRNWSFLLFGEEIATAESWLRAAEGKDPSPTEQHRDYILASRAAEVERSAQAALLERRARQFRLAAAFLGVIGLLSLLAAAVSAPIAANALSEVADAQQTLSAARGEIEALRLGELALDHLGTSRLNAEAAALLAVRGLSQGYSPQADAALIRASDQLYGLQTYLGHTGQLSGATFSPDGRFVLTTGQDWKARLWEAASGQPLGIVGEADWRVSAAAFLPGADAILTVSGRNLSRIEYSTEYTTEHATGAAETLYLNDDPRSYGATYAQVMPLADGRTVVLVTDVEAQVFDLVAGQVVRRFALEDGAEDGAAAVSADGRRLALMQDDQVALFDIASGERLRLFQGGPPLALSSDGAVVAAQGTGGAVQLWDAADGRSSGRLAGHTGPLTAMAFSPDDRWLATGSADTTVRLWDWRTGEAARVLTGNIEAVASVAWSPDGQRLLTAGIDRTARLWDASNPNTQPLPSAAPDETRWQTFPGAIELPQDTPRVQGAYQLFAGSALRIVEVLARSPDGRYTVTGHSGGLIALWSGQEVTTPLYTAALDDPLRFISIAFAPDGGSFALAEAKTSDLSGSRDNRLHVFDRATGVRRWSMNEAHAREILSMTYTPDGAYLVTASTDTTARVWDAATGALVMTLRGHTGRVTGVLASPDGGVIVTRGDDDTLRLWRRADGRLLRALPAPDVARLAFGADGLTFFTINVGGQRARRWHVRYGDFVAEVCRRLRRDFSEAERIEFALPDAVPTCDTDIDASTASQATAIPTAPLAVWTPLSTPTITATPRPTLTSTPTARPSPTHTPQQQGEGFATAGQQRGTITLGGGQIWFYAGRAGEVLTVRASADHPADDVPSAERVNKGVLDIRLILRDANGQVLAENDDFSGDTPATDAEITAFVLPYSDFYSIEVRSFADATEGAYTLVIESSLP